MREISYASTFYASARPMKRKIERQYLLPIYKACDTFDIILNYIEKKYAK